MQSTVAEGMDVSSELADLREVPLHELAAGAPVARDMAVQRVLPAPAGAGVRGAAFSSAI